MASDDQIFNVRIEPAGFEFNAPVSGSLLKAAFAAQLSMPSSCRNGTCRTCLCRLQSGVVSYQIEWPGLTREEKQEGFILPCVAVAQSDLVIDIPDAVSLK